MILFSIFVFTLIDLSMSVCCKYIGFGKGYHCCSFTKCSIFCCNCNYRTGNNGQRLYCKPNDKCNVSSDALLNIVGAAAGGLRKRDISTLPSVDSVQYFKTLDKNKDGGICIKEATAFVMSHHGNDSFIKENPKWFTSLDLNNNGVVDLNEFDQDGDEEEISIYF